MSGTLNKATIIGRLGKDPEIRQTQSGTRIVSISVATEETWRDKQTGERKKKTEWHRVVCFNDKLGEIIEKYVRKGSLVYFEGQLSTRKWTDSNNVERYTTEIVMPNFGGVMKMLSGGDQDQQDGQDRARVAGYTRHGQAPAGSARGAQLDDDIPF